MPLSFACAVSHAPGIVAWRDAAPAAQRDRLYAGFEVLRGRLAAARLDAIVLFTSEHWTNFFLDHMSAFCVGRAATFSGPVEPWLKIDKAIIRGAPLLARSIIERCYAEDVEPGFSDELELDHGTIIPLHLLDPGRSHSVVPIIVNSLAPPQPSARRCYTLGQIVGDLVRASPRRIGIVASGGLSHDPGERNHGQIDEDFDRQFLSDMTSGRADRLVSYTPAQLAAAGAGAFELLGWIAAAGALGEFTGEVVAYEAVKPWATGIGLMSFSVDPGRRQTRDGTGNAPVRA